MIPKDYVVVIIEGEYVYLREIDAIDNQNDLFIALALLPEGVDLGTKLHYEMMEYSIIQ